MRFSTEEDNSEVVAKKSSKKLEVKKEVTVAFQTKLKKIEEADETPSKSSEDREGVSIRKGSQKNERPQSAGCLPRRGLDRGFRKWPKTRETFRGEIRKRESELEMKKRLKDMFDVRETSSREGLRCECATMLDLESSCSSSYGCRARSCLCDYETDWWTSYNHYKVGTQQRRCRSNPSFSKTIFEKEKDLHKMKRSLRLIGLELSDFGIYSNDIGNGMETTPRCKVKRKSPTFSTKVTGRSFSLESLRHAIRRAWLDDRLDESHRRLLSQAAYEEWYFKKEKELQEKQKEEKQRQAVAKESMRKDFERKKAKAEEEFRQWMNRKRIKGRENENLEKRSDQGFGRIKKTKQDAEAAFLKWKREKDKELEKKKLQEKKEEERKMESERQKNEKKIIAEKAFQQWKTKLEESEKLEEKKRKKLKRKQEELEKRQKQEQGSQISFQVWKKAKDEEIRQQMKQIREIRRMEREERQARVEERLYEAEQAFEDWLEKIDLRKQKQFCDNFPKIPWIPA